MDCVKYNTTSKPLSQQVVILLELSQVHLSVHKK